MMTGEQQGKELAAKFKQKAVKIEKEITKKLMMCGLLVERDAKLNCPVDTGRLRASIATVAESDTSVAVGTYVEYAADVEFGSSKQRPQPYLTPALDTNKPEINKRIKDAIISEIRSK